MTQMTQTNQIPTGDLRPATTPTVAATRVHQSTVMRLGRRSQAAEHTAAPGPGQHPSPQRAVQPTVRIPTTRPARHAGSIVSNGSLCCVHCSSRQTIATNALGYANGLGDVKWGDGSAGTIRNHPTPGGTPVSTQQPQDRTDHYHQHVRQAWDNYQKAEQTRAEASQAVNAALADARAGGISMYRMAKWLGVWERTIQARLQKYDQTNTPPPPAG